MTQCINLLLLKDVKTVWENKNEVDYKKKRALPQTMLYRMILAKIKNGSYHSINR